MMTYTFTFTSVVPPPSISVTWNSCDDAISCTFFSSLHFKSHDASCPILIFRIYKLRNKRVSYLNSLKSGQFKRFQT